MPKSGYILSRVEFHVSKNNKCLLADKGPAQDCGHNKDWQSRMFECKATVLITT